MASDLRRPRFTSAVMVLRVSWLISLAFPLEEAMALAGLAGVLTDGRVFAHSEMIALNYEVSYISRFDREVHQARL